jgi:hypothetical protein
LFAAVVVGQAVVGVGCLFCCRAAAAGGGTHVAAAFAIDGDINGDYYKKSSSCYYTTCANRLGNCGEQQRGGG